MTNPNNAIGTNGAYGGRTSVNAFNDNLAIYQGRGVLSGFVVSPNTGMSVAIGGDGSTRDVAIAEDNIGNKTTINNISESPISLTIAGAPASNSRIDAIVAYVDNPAQGSATEPDNPGACGLLDVQGAVSATPSQPDENAIRTAITADGASGTTAYYVVLGYITVANGTTDITSNMISAGSQANIQPNSIPDGAITSDKTNSETFPCCLAYKSQDKTNAQPGIVDMDTFITNVGGFTINSDGALVVPKAGKYLISGGIGGLFSASKGWVRLNVNGVSVATVIDRSNNSSLYKSLNVGAVVVELQKNDVVYLSLVEEVAVLGGGGLNRANFLSLAMIP